MNRQEAYAHPGGPAEAPNERHNNSNTANNG